MHGRQHKSIGKSWRNTMPMSGFITVPLRMSLRISRTVDFSTNFMQRQTVSSSNLKSVGYDAATQTLEIEFQHGRIYQYRSVPKSEYLTLIGADPLGSYFNDFIRDCYPCNRVR